MASCYAKVRIGPDLHHDSVLGIGNSQSKLYLLRNEGLIRVM